MKKRTPDELGRLVSGLKQHPTRFKQQVSAKLLEQARRIVYLEGELLLGRPARKPAHALTLQ